MIMATNLLGSSIYEIKETWMGLDELCQVNYALRALPKGLKFLKAVPPSESLKVMGLMDIHDLDALHHFYGVTCCPWCRKVGQNKGIVINHLWTIHYRLGLVCEEVSWLSTHIIRGYLPPWLERMSTIRGGQCQRVILIGITTSRRYAESPLLEDLREILVSLGLPCQE